MSLSFEHAFVIKAPADRVWSFLIDPYRVAPALPGASITEKNEDGSYAGAITVKVGPVAAKYRGKVRFEAVDAAARTVRIVATGQETNGRGGADMRMNSRIVEKTAGETEVNLASEVNVTGVLAQFGRGMIQDVSNQMFQKFSEAIRAELEKPEATPAPEAPAGSTDAAAAPPAPPAMTQAPPIDAVALGGRVAGLAALRALRSPLLWGFLLLVILAMYFWLR
jgi:carbon monoxide dehydrogenase subunit G